MIVLITGATDGLGRGLARALDADGHTVLVHGRSEQRIADTLEVLSGRARSYRADLASLAAVERLADEVLAAEPELDVLVNNAGIGGRDRREESADGYELHFAVNYLAGFLLTRRLGDLPGRVVNVSSAGQAPIDFDDVMLEHDFSGWQAYCQSKLAQIMFTFDLADDGVTAAALHPATYMPTKMVASPISPLEEGVEATQRLVTAPAGEITGRYFDGTREAHAHAQAYDADARRALRELSERLTLR
jgi:NAD(P)-dependent dehydrogenase (short-subunit alcohol dehydrogenase family)